MEDSDDPSRLLVHWNCPGKRGVHLLGGFVSDDVDILCREGGLLAWPCQALQARAPSTLTPVAESSTCIGELQSTTAENITFVDAWTVSRAGQNKVTKYLSIGA